MFGALAGKHVLVTGADGFIGSHLAERLLAEGARVSVFVRATSRASIGGPALRHLAHVADRLGAVLWGDLASADAEDRIAQLAPQIVLHLAADAWVPRSFEHPREVIDTNVGSTLAVLHAAMRTPGVERVVVTSSSEVYGTAQAERIDESHPLEPTSPYAASKVACDRIAAAYHRTYGIPIAIIRPFNTYGPRHVYDVIPKMIELALRGEPLVVHGTGRQTRDFTYVDDMVEAFLHVATHPDAIGRAVNFGTGRDVAIADLARAIQQIAGSSSPIVHGPERKAQVARLCCDASLARRLFGWEARIGLEEGLARNIQWAREAR